MSEPIPDDYQMPFGKYKGWKIENVPASYLLFLHGEGRIFGDVKQYIEENLEILRLEEKQLKSR